MNKMFSARGAVVVALIILFVALLVSCSGESSTVPERQLDGQITIINVEGMPCVIYRGYEKGGIDCDWTRFDGVVPTAD